jgi:hypothetical protein
MALLVVSALSAVWFFFASQIPSSGFRADVLPGPVAQLRDAAGFLGLLMFATSWLMPAAESKGSAKLLVVLLHIGVVFTLAALCYGANTGMLGLQIDDPRKDSRWLLIARFVGELLIAGTLVEFGRRILSGLRKPSH